MFGLNGKKTYDPEIDIFESRLEYSQVNLDDLSSWMAVWDILFQTESSPVPGNIWGWL